MRGEDNNRHTRQFRTEATEKPRLGAVGVDDVRPLAADEAEKVAEGHGI